MAFPRLARGTVHLRFGLLNILGVAAIDLSPNSILYERRCGFTPEPTELMNDVPLFSIIHCLKC